MRVLNRFMLAAALVLAASQPRVADAKPLNLTLPQFPDILSQFIDVDYDAGSDALSANGYALQILAGPGQLLSIANGVFDIGIVTDGASASGRFGDDLVIVGDLDVDSNGTTDFSGALLTGEIAQFGANAQGPGIFEFVFDVTGGFLAQAFGAQAGVVLGADGNSTYAGNFDASFSNLTGGLAGTGTGSADTAPIPEPGTLLLLGSGVAGLVGFGRRERR